MRVHRDVCLVTALILAVFVSACATRVEGTLPTSTPDQILTKALSYQRTYIANRNRLEKAELFFDASLIGAAAGAVATLAYIADPARGNALAGLGIGAGVLTSARTYLAPSESAIVYQNAADAMDCIIQASTRLLSEPVDVSALRDRLDDIDDELITAKEAQSRPDAEMVPIAIRNNLAQAVTAATAARTAGQQELNASQTANADVNRAINQIDSKVFSLTKLRPQSYTDLVQSIQSTATFSAALAQAKQGNVAQPAPAGGAAPAVATTANAMINAASNLARFSAQTTALIDSAGYVSMQNAVKACAALL